MKDCIDLNVDLGEGFGPWRIGDGVDEQLIPLISSANVATGFHAGDPTLMRRTVAFAKDHGVGVGAHPGFRDLVGFGRRQIKAPTAEILNDILYQVGALREFTRLAGIDLQHVKPHGALYMHMASDEALSIALVEALQITSPTLPLYCMGNSITCHVARERGHPVMREFFADRDYDASGSIVFTRHVGRLDAEQVAQKVLQACTEGSVQTVDGTVLPIAFDSVCIHSDTPGALDLLRATRRALDAAGIRVLPMRDVLARAG